MFNLNFIKLVNSLEYIDWKIDSLFCHFVEFRTLYTSVGDFLFCFMAAHEYQLSKVPHLSFVNRNWAPFSKIIYLAYATI